MHATLFSLVATDNPDLVFAWGMEIADGEYQEDEANRTAVVYIGGPNGKASISTHASAEHACRRWSTVAPVSIVWDVDTWADVFRQVSTHRPLEEQHAEAQP